MQEVRDDTLLIAIYFESQIVEKVLMEDHDVRMDKVISELNCYRCVENGY
ncbi:MAG: hypothetical protein HFP81_08880 [Methylococcales symbiont of Hymedesmia sp. n. MRB-2018]|nr:MAG: hypothetical protein HFP78_09325 [Methylococcales symbiont of Hymedesmia sp. n. MRB-2018]KAF3983078.1 MAG: hypothetical protein HFP81_08880 [Methylococcales symbiont of Hymedesmia sp. n. MRB-2018]